MRVEWGMEVDMGEVQKTEEKKNSPIWGNLGKIFIDLGKLTFGSFILGGILRGEVGQFTILLAGGIITIIFIALGLLLSAKNKE
jgi:hypothetical protein